MANAKLRLGLAIVLLVGAVALIAVGISSISSAPKPQVATESGDRVVEIMVAAKDIPRGEKIDTTMLRPMKVVAPPPAGSFGDPRSVVDSIALAAIPSGQTVLSGTILAPGDGTKPGLSVLVPEGMRAVALRVNDEVAVGNFVRSDDLVDIQLVLANQALGPTEGTNSPERRESSVILQAIKVLSVGETLTVQQGDQAVRMQNVTVAVTPEQALVLAVAKNSGVFYLGLRNPVDTEQQDVPRVRLEDLVVAAKREPTPSDPSLPAPSVVAPRQIEIIMGTSSGRQAVP